MLTDRHTIELAQPENEGRYLVKCYGRVIGQYMWTNPPAAGYACFYSATEEVMYTLGMRPDARAAFEAILDSHDCDIDTIGGE